jgi:hypothetical protein
MELLSAAISKPLDFASGGVYNIVPENVHVELEGVQAAPTP